MPRQISALPDADHLRTEAQWRTHICSARGWDEEVQTDSGAYVDCVGSGVAWEVDWSSKWAEAIGQSLLYSAELRMRPGIILLCRKGELYCLRHKYRLQVAIGQASDVDFEIMYVEAK